MQPEEVFVTDGFPEHTYVRLDDGRAEHELFEGLEQKNKIISIVGPSKSGKATLCDSAFGLELGDDKMYVTGDSIKYADDVWREAYRQITDDTDKSFEELSHSERITHLVNVEIPLIVDDFHYIPKLQQHLLCRQFKNAASAGLRLIILSTPHRGDDPIRNNSDLVGRYFSVNLPLWQPRDLSKIAEIGFPRVELPVTTDFCAALAMEALGSPQIMQTLCLEVCRSISVAVSFEDVKVAEIDLKEVKRRALRSYNMSTSLHRLKNGPPKRGSDRLEFELSDGTKADVYQILVKILQMSPPFDQLSLDQIKARMKLILANKREPNIRAALQQIENIFKGTSPPIEWDDEKRQFTINDPHFYFYVRNVV